jgi:hypothetical protein
MVATPGHCFVATTGYHSLALASDSEPVCLRTPVQFSKLLLVLDSRVKVILRQTVSGPVCLCVTPPSEAQDQIFITVRQLRVWWCGALSLTRGWVWRLQLLLALASVVIPESESRGTHDHILLSQLETPPTWCARPTHIYIPKEQGAPVIPPGIGFPIRRLLRIIGLRWRYSNLPQRRGQLFFKVRVTLQRHGPHIKHRIGIRLFVAAEACLTNLSLAMAISSSFAIPAFSRHVTVYF